MNSLERTNLSNIVSSMPTIKKGTWKATHYPIFVDLCIAIVKLVRIHCPGLISLYIACRLKAVHEGVDLLHRSGDKGIAPFHNSLLELQVVNNKEKGNISNRRT
jgi:hypothetical protein